MGYQNGLVVFIDVLGTKNETDFEKKFFIHNLWHDSAKEIEERGSSFKEVRTLSRKVFSFSDCAYYIYLFNERASEERKKSMAPFDEVLQSLSGILQKIMVKGFFIRGGAVLGDVYVDKKGMFGPAVEQAYYLESKCANYPRIIFEENLGSKLLGYTQEAYHPGSQPIIYKDNNVYYLNVFYGFCSDMNNGLTWDIFFDKISTNAKNTIQNIDNFNIGEKEKDKIKKKMEWILEILHKENELLPRYSQVLEECWDVQVRQLLRGK